MRWARRPGSGWSWSRRRRLAAFDYLLLGFYVAVPCYFFLRFARANGFPLPVFGGQLLLVCALFLLGVDYFRWVHLLFFSTVTTVVAILVSNRAAVLPATSRFERLALALYILPLGPIGVAEPLPYIERIWSEVVLKLL